MSKRRSVKESAANSQHALWIAIVSGLLTLAGTLFAAYFSYRAAIDSEKAKVEANQTAVAFLTAAAPTITITPTETVPTLMPSITATVPTPTNTYTPVPTPVYDFEDGTVQGWEIFHQTNETILKLAPSKAASFSGRSGLQVDLDELSVDWGATLCSSEMTPTHRFEVRALLPGNAPDDVEIWLQLAAMTSEDYLESPSVVLSPGEWKKLAWDTTEHQWQDGFTSAICIQLIMGKGVYTGPIYLDAIMVE